MKEYHGAGDGLENFNVPEYINEWNEQWTQRLLLAFKIEIWMCFIATHKSGCEKQHTQWSLV